MSAAAETINVEEKFSGSSLNSSQAGSPDGADNLFAPDSESEFYQEENGTSNGLEHAIDPKVRRAYNLVCIARVQDIDTTGFLK